MSKQVWGIHMKSFTNSISAAAILLTASAALAQDRDPFVGEYGGDCGPDVQCWVEVEKAGKDYKVSFIAADRMDASKVLCRVDSMMDRGQVLYSPQESWDDALGGTFQGSNTYAALGVDGGSLILGGGLTAGRACDVFFWKQEYYLFGDE